MLTPHLHLAPKLRMSGAILLLPLYGFMKWAGTHLLVPLTSNKTAVMIKRCSVSYKVIILGCEFGI